MFFYVCVYLYFDLCFILLCEFILRGYHPNIFFHAPLPQVQPSAYIDHLQQISMAKVLCSATSPSFRV